MESILVFILGDEIITCSEDNTARIWKIKDFDDGVFMKQILQHDDHVFAALYTECNSKIITACKNNTCKLWDRTK